MRGGEGCWRKGSGARIGEGGEGIVDASVKSAVEVEGVEAASE